MIDKDLITDPAAPNGVQIDDIDQYRKHVVYYFDTQVSNDIINLSEEDKARCFQMFHDYSDVLEKMFHPGIDIIEHVLGKRFHAATTNPHDGINLDHQCPIIEQYDAWLAATYPTEA